MSTLVRVLAWLCIGLGALYSAEKLARLVRSRGARKQRGERPPTASEAWSSIRTYVLTAAVGLSVLGNQWKFYTAKWWLAQLPLFALLTLYLASWIRSRIRRRSGRSTIRPS
jgi:hypothetical protein